MNMREFTILAGVVGRTSQALQLKDRNAVKQAARHSALHLLVTDLVATLEHEYPKTFDKEKFLKACGL